MKTKKYSLKKSPGSAYDLVICTKTQCYRYGLMTFIPGKHYQMSISKCDFPGVLIESHEINGVVTKLPALVRFRSRRVLPTEYRHSNSRFRKLSVGMSSYQKLSQPQDNLTTFQFRHRIARNGPVSYMSTHTFRNLKLGRKYFIEVEYFGNQKELVKIQDEGVNESSKK